MNDLREAAQVRVRRCPALQVYEGIIMYDWPAGDEHWAWVAQGNEQEIEEWAESIYQQVSSECEGVRH